MNFNTTSAKPFLTCKDHSISGENFSLIHNRNLDLLKTDPIPENLEPYYESKDYISHTDGKTSVFEFVYQTVKNYALSLKLQHLKKYHPKKGRLLDLGAGTGDFLKRAKDKGWAISGVEPNMGARQKAEGKEVYLEKGLEKLKNNKYDAITLWHVLEHVTNLEETIAQLKNALEANGTLFIAVPNFKSFDANHYQQFWAAYDVPRHIWHFSRTAIKAIFENHELTLVETIPMKFDAYYVSLLSEKYKSGFMNPFKAFYIASLSNYKARSTKEYSSLIYVLKHQK